MKSESLPDIKFILGKYERIIINKINNSKDWFYKCLSSYLLSNTSEETSKDQHRPTHRQST